MFLTGCSSDESDNPLSFIDGYTVDLLESKGNSYTGDYFPIEEGHTCNYSGSAIMQTKMTIPGYDPIDETTISPTLGMLKVLALRDIPLLSGTVPLYPIVDLTDMEGEITADTSRFFSKDDEAVYVKAIKMSDGSYLEVENPVFIKSSLVVGESWATAPQMDMTQLLTAEFGDDADQSDINLNAKSKFFVVGHEMISLPIGTRWAMRLEQVNDITMTGILQVEGIPVNINTTAKLATVYHMIPDTGIVHQNTTGPLNMKMTFEGQSITIKIDIEKSEINLTDMGDDGFYKNNSTSINQSLNESINPSSFNMSMNRKLWKISQIIARFATKKLGL
jgi:hypothetical protein